MPRKCTICNKSYTKEKVKIFEAPMSDSRRKRWSESCGVELNISAKVCEKHFTRSDFIAAPGSHKRSRLMPSAKPLPEITGCTRAQQQQVVQSNNEVQAKSLESTLETTAIPTNVGIDAMNAVLPDMDAICSEVAFDGKVSEIVVSLQPAATVADASTTTDHIQCRDILEKMDLKKRVAELEAEVVKLKSQLEEANCLNTGVKTIFTEGQIQRLKYPQKISHWFQEDISNAVCLHAASSRAYNLLYEKGFPFPSLTTLKRWARKDNFDEGVLKFSISSMKHWTDLTFDEKICVLSFEEIKLSSIYEHDPLSDTVRAPCNFVQVAMVRGLKSSWKQPIFYSFDCKMTKDILKKIVNALHDTGYTVVAMVSDMCSSNQNLWTELGITATKTWFENPASPPEKIFVFADVPHLLELIRSNFLDTGLLFDKKIISTQTIKQLMHHTFTSDVPITLKLTEQHFTVNQAGRQNVKLAAQLFSNTTANALRWLHSNGTKFHNPLETADFFQLVNDWFDVLNSKQSTSFNVPSQQPFGEEFPAQNKILLDMDKIMSKPIIPGKASLASFQEGILISNSSLRLLRAYVLQRNNIDYIATCKLNQDLLEEFLEAIKSNAGVQDHPSPMEFKNSLRKYLLGQASFLVNQDGDSAIGVFGELNDLNKKFSSITETNQHKNNADSVDKSFKHHDEDMPRLQNNLELEESLNYDVEILESGDIKKENIEIEERFRGNAVKVNTDTFFAENIEVHGGDDIHQSHMILTMILLIVALISIALYAVLVIWRSHLEQRYGMRELLVNDDDDYCQQQNNNNNNRNAAGHFSIVQL